MASSSAAWTPVGSLLAGRFTVFAPDLLGHGQTAKPAGDYSLGAHATLLRDLLLVLGYERATLVGHSFGGGVAMQFAYQFPELCERLVLVGSGGLGREVDLLLRALALPGADHVLRLVCRTSLTDAGRTVVEWARRVGFGPTPAAQDNRRGYPSRTAPPHQRAYHSNPRAAIGGGGPCRRSRAPPGHLGRLPAICRRGGQTPCPSSPGTSAARSRSRAAARRESAAPRRRPGSRPARGSRSSTRAASTSTRPPQRSGESGSSRCAAT